MRPTIRFGIIRGMRSDPIPHRPSGRLVFVVPADPDAIANALVERFAYIDACPIVDPDRSRLNAWLQQRTGSSIEATFDPQDALEDLEFCMEALANGGTFSFGNWPIVEIHGGRLAGGYVVCDGGGEILWRPILRRIVDPDDTSATMRMAGLSDSSIGLAQALLGRLVIA